VTGSSLRRKTPVIKEIEMTLGDKNVKTLVKLGNMVLFKRFGRPLRMQKNPGVYVFISVGG